jgi:hypothetical protein
LLGALPNTPPYEKAQRLLSVSEAVIDAVRKYWLFRSPNTDMSAMMYVPAPHPLRKQQTSCMPCWCVCVCVCVCRGTQGR